MVKCAICKTSREKCLKLFDAPKDEQRRKAWTASSGFDITEKSLICNLHFSEADFYSYGRGTTKCRLKTSAVPKKPEPANSLAHVKPEPEFVPVVAEIASKSFESYAVIKEEPIDSQSLSFINEAGFDVGLDDPILLDLNRSAPRENSTEEGIECAVKTLSCGHIIMETTSAGNQTFNLICDHCQTKFSTSNENFWSTFVKHINDAHIPQPLIKAVANDKAEIVIDSKKSGQPPNNTGDIQLSATENVKTRFELNKNKEKEENEMENDLDDSRIEDDKESYNENSHDFNDSDWEDETFEPIKKKKKRTSAVKTDESNEVETMATQNEILSFNHPDKNCIIKFLELLTTRAILWLPRQSIMKRFDEVLMDLTSKFNEFFPSYALTKDRTRQSIKHIKELYQRLTEIEKVENIKTKRRSKTTEYKAKFPEYFELCAEIEENSRNILQNCDICNTTYHSPQDLQVHKYKKHKIGELPYKCQRCCYGFACPEKLASHEEKHNRSKSCKCEVCGQGFYFESKLQAHMALHTDDSKQICEICGKKFPSLSKYRRHKLHHEAPKEKCEICGKLYFEKWTLSEHIKSHKNERQYRCDICGKTFNRQEGVTIHKRGVHKIKTQTKKYVWVNRVTSSSSMSNAETTSGSQNEDDNLMNDEFMSLAAGGNDDCVKTTEIQSTNSNSTSFSSAAANDETISYDVKPTIPNNANQQNMSDCTRQRIKNIKDLYQRLKEIEKVDNIKTKRRSKTTEYKTKLPEYFELCAEIEENSRQNCDICNTTFYSPQDLEVHKYKKHKIGELPYKCQRCCYGFACPEKLASHEEKHNRSKSCKCENALVDYNGRQVGGGALQMGMGMCGFPAMPNINSLLSADIGSPNGASCCLSSVITMSSGPDGRPQVYQATTSTKTGPGSILRETRKTVQDSTHGIKKLQSEIILANVLILLKRYLNITNRTLNRAYDSNKTVPCEHFDSKINILGSVTREIL